MRTVAFCEIEPYARRVLAKHWPGVPCYEDVRTLTADRLRADGISVDVICGGFPCQDISTAGKGAGIGGERSGLWKEYARIVGELRPRFVIVENVSALLSRGLDVVLGDLAALGFDAEWHCIPASSVGAPHRRDRIWIVADATGERRGKAWKFRHVESAQWSTGFCEEMANAHRNNVQGVIAGLSDKKEWGRSIKRSIGSRGDGDGWWSVEPDVGRVAHGVPDRTHRLKALGNAVVPQIPEIIGRAIMNSMKEVA